MKVRTTSRRSKQVALADWRELNDGDDVNILKNAKIVAQGRVDEVSGSGGVLWIVDEKAETRHFSSRTGFLSCGASVPSETFFERNKGEARAAGCSCRCHDGPQC